MASHPSTRTRQQGDDGDLLSSLVRGERGQTLRAQLAARYPQFSADTIEDAIQFACRRFLDRAEGITAPGQVYAWIRTTAQRDLNREADRHHREVAVDPVEDGMDRLAAEESGPVEELIELEDDADLAVLVEKVSSSLTDRQRDVFALYGAGCKRSQIADRLGMPERDVKEQLRLIMDKSRAVLASLTGGGAGEGSRWSCGSSAASRPPPSRPGRASTSPTAGAASSSASDSSPGERRPARCFRLRSPKARAPAC